MDSEETFNSKAASSQSQQGFSTERDFSDFYSADEPAADIPDFPQSYDEWARTHNNLAGLDTFLEELDREDALQEGWEDGYSDQSMFDGEDAVEAVEAFEAAGPFEAADLFESAGSLEAHETSKAFEAPDTNNEAFDLQSAAKYLQPNDASSKVSSEGDISFADAIISLAAQASTDDATHDADAPAAATHHNVQHPPKRQLVNARNAAVTPTPHQTPVNHAATNKGAVVISGNPRAEVAFSQPAILQPAVSYAGAGQAAIPQQSFIPAPIFVPTPSSVGRAYGKRKSHKVATAIGIILALVVAIALIFIFLVPWDRTITVDGRSMTAKAHTTLADLAKSTPNTAKPGDLLAIDGSVITEGGGLPYTFTVNGTVEPNYDREVWQGDEIEIDDGEDKVEDFTEEVIEVAPPVVIEGTGAVHRYANSGSAGKGTKKVGAVSGIVQMHTESDPVTETMERFNVDTGGDKVIALTFDDGPWPTYTEQILQILGDNNAKATFFTVGNCIGKLKDTVKRASDAGHQICTHSWDHASGSGQGVNLDYMTDDEQREEIAKGMQAISDATGAEASKVVRVPGGNLSENTAKILREFATSEIGWNIDTNDWRRPGASVVSARIQAATPGDIILMHDGGGDRSQTVEALREALPILREQGYRFITIDELLSTYA